MADKTKILFVEDDEFLRSLGIKRLEEAGFKVQIATTGEEALKMIQEETPDLVLLDIVLPGVDGFEVLKKIKEEEETRSIPVILLTNLGQEDSAKKGLSLGADDYLVKAQFTLGEIVERVQKLLAK